MTDIQPLKITSSCVIKDASKYTCIGISKFSAGGGHDIGRAKGGFGASLTTEREWLIMLPDGVSSIEVQVGGIGQDTVLLIQGVPCFTLKAGEDGFDDGGIIVSGRDGLPFKMKVQDETVLPKITSFSKTYIEGALGLPNQPGEVLINLYEVAPSDRTNVILIIGLPIALYGWFTGDPIVTKTYPLTDGLSIPTLPTDTKNTVSYYGYFHIHGFTLPNTLYQFPSNTASLKIKKTDNGFDLLREDVVLCSSTEPFTISWFDYLPTGFSTQ